MTLKEWMAAAYPDVLPNTGPWMLCQNAWNAALAAADAVCSDHAAAAEAEGIRLEDDGETELAEQTDAAIHGLGVAAEDIRGLIV